ncbi:MAG: DUF4186 family protein [Candidatus Nanoarchaeia archaeon]
MYEQILSKLAKSKFRSSFKLNEEHKKDINKKGLEIIREHASEILEKRVKIKKENDGWQTPLSGYYIFVAQHATATCCRKCIEKWHKIPKDKILTQEELDFFAGLIIEWINGQINKLD